MVDRAIHQLDDGGAATGLSTDIHQARIHNRAVREFDLLSHINIRPFYVGGCGNARGRGRFMA
jgi:hypothetical protein